MYLFRLGVAGARWRGLLGAAERDGARLIRWHFIQPTGVRSIGFNLGEHKDRSTRHVIGDFRSASQCMHGHTIARAHCNQHVTAPAARGCSQPPIEWWCRV